MTQHTPTPWFYRPHRHDDWGWIRAAPADGDEIGPIIAMVRSGKYETEAELDEHRRNKTDPHAVNTAFVLKACNEHDALRRRVACLEMIIREDLHPDDCSDDANRMIVEGIHAMVPHDRNTTQEKT